MGFEEWRNGLKFVIRKGRGYRRKGRIYQRKGQLVAWESAYFYTIYVQNWKGSGVNISRETWTYTTHASVATENRITEETYSKIVESVYEISDWVQDELRLHNTSTPTTLGSTSDEPRKRSDLSEAPGWVRWKIEDKQVATVFTGLRQEEFWRANEVVAEVKERIMLDYVGGTVKARLAR